MLVCKKAWGHPFATFGCWDHQTVMKWIPFFVVFLCTALPGCGQSRSPEEVFTQLLERISNVTEVTVKSMDPVNLLPSYPRPRDLVLPLEDIRVGFSTYIGLGRCGLVGEVSARNSSLGKFQSPTARLLYERRFLRQLKRCIQDLQQSNEKEPKKFLAEVQSIADKKTAILPTVYWNATFGSPEFRVLLSTHTEALPKQSSSTSTELVTALRFISPQGLERQSDQNPKEQSILESQYYILQSSKLIGQLLQGMVVATRSMQQGSELLETVAEKRQFCPMGRKTVKADYLFNVFQKFYIGEAQPYISLIHTQARPLVEAIHELVQEQKIEIPDAFQAFYDQTLNSEVDKSAWVKFNKALSRHTIAWQSVLKQCELMPRI
ncbi:MAG: DUF3080 family protein [Methylococcus sp.]|nr:MAG: DUF3080 family protein [Methylococcus sp.]